jgi:hypothetical protein
MSKLGFLAAIAVVAFPAAALAQSRDVIIHRIIDESRASYRGACPCPYDLSRDGKECGAPSAYMKAGGIMCFPRDVTERDIKHYRHGR